MVFKNNKMNLNRLEFSKEIIEVYIKDILITHPKLAIEFKQNIYTYGSKKEIYLKEVFRLYTIINDTIEKLYLSIKYLSIENPIREVDEIDFYKLHIEYYNIKCISVFDYCINMINHSAQLGIPQKKCKYNNIIENVNLKNTLLVQKLKLYEKEVSKIKTDRNIIIHEGDWKSDSLNEIDSKILCNDFFNHGKEITEYFQQEKQILIKKSIKLISKQIKVFESHIGEIYICLIPIIIKRIKYFELDEKE